MTDVLNNIANALNEFFGWFSELSWPQIWETLKNWLLGGGAVAVVGIAVKYGIPFFKGQSTAMSFANILAEISVLKSQNQTAITGQTALKDALKTMVEYAQAVSQVNITSKTLTSEQKSAFELLLPRLAIVDAELAERVATAISDGVVTASEAIDVAAAVPKLKEPFGTSLDDILVK